VRSALSCLPLVFLLACSDDAAKPAPACEQGDAVSCSCGAGKRGEATCDADGEPGRCVCLDEAKGDDEATPTDDGEADEDQDTKPTGTRDAGNKPIRVDAGGGTTGTLDAGKVASTEAGATSSTPAPRGDKTCLAGTSADYNAMGPYQVKTKPLDLGGSLGPYTVFYPTMLESDCLHPIVGWGNGTGVTGSDVYAHFFRHAASWGLVVIAAHNENAGSQPFIAGGLDYLLKENGTAGSEFFGKLSTRAGTAGHSQGGFAAVTAASHANVEAVVSVQGGGSPPAKVAFVCETGVEDFVRTQCTASYTSAKGPAFLADHTSADHINTPTTLGARTPAGQEYIRIFTSWFRCYLADDATACALYQGGKAAPLCSMGDWATCDGKNL